MALHPVAQVGWTGWSVHWSTVIGIAALGALYFWRVARAGSPETPTGLEKLWFVSGLFVMFVSLNGPIHDLSDYYLFSAHMVQHLLLASLWPVLFLLGLPPWLVAPIFRRPVLGSVIDFLTLPVVALTFFNVDLIAWHLPVLYDLTLSNELVHVVEHLSFMAFGLLNFWPVLSPIRAQRLAYPFQVLYLFADGMFMMVLGILFTFAPFVFYTPYVTAPRLFSISALSDQQIGGLIMWYPGNLPYGVLLCMAFFRWFDGEEVAQPERPGIAAPSHTIRPPLT